MTVQHYARLGVANFTQRLPSRPVDAHLVMRPGLCCRAPRAASVVPLRAARALKCAHRLEQSISNFFAVRGINTPPITSQGPLDPTEHAPDGTIADFARYLELRREWEAAHPGASAAEHTAAMQRLAAECGVS